MRKWIILLLTLLAAMALFMASADASFAFAPIDASADLPDGYIILTPENLSSQQDWLTANQKDEEVLAADWEQRGVLLQVWSPDSDICIEVSAIQDDIARQYFDIDAQTTAIRSSYRKDQSSGEGNKALGYTIVNAEWKKYTSGRFLLMQYKRTVNGIQTNGYLRRTIRNGYSVSVDYQVFGRKLNKKDLKQIDAIMASWSFATVKPVPADTVGELEFESAPPEETNTGKFTVEGKTTAGVVLTGTLMRMADPTPIHVTATAKKTGKFSMPVELPTEGIWLMTVTVERDGVVIAEKVFEPTTYAKDLLPVNLDQPIPEQLSEDVTVISGKTIKNVSVQCIVNTVDGTYDKMVKTNNSGLFSFKVPTAAEAEYNVTLVFQKKGYSTRRFTYTAVRELTEEDIRAQVKANVVKPAYSTLTKKIDGYTGKNMVYKIYVTDIQQSGEEWIIFAALDQTAKGTYKNMIVIIASEEPELAVGAQVKFYGTCTGSYQVQSEEGNETYPCFDYLFVEN